MPRLFRPQTLSETLRLLAESGEDTKVVAGGTAVMLMMRAGLLHPEELISIDRVAELNYVTVEPTAIRLGALACMRDLERSNSLSSVLPTLTGAIALVANHRVRRRATIGGCISEADYASDPPAVLASLGANVRIASLHGEREIPVSDFLVGYYETALRHDELVKEIVIPRPSSGVHTTYLKYVSRSAEDRPCVGVAAYVDTEESGRPKRVRVAVAGATATPFMLGDIMAILNGSPLDSAACRAIGDAYQDAIEPISDARGSSDYRRRVTGRLVTRALQTALTESGNKAFRL